MALHNAGRSQEVTLHCCWPVVSALALPLRYAELHRIAGGFERLCCTRFKHPKAYFFTFFFNIFEILAGLCKVSKELRAGQIGISRGKVIFFLLLFNKHPYDVFVFVCLCVAF